MFLSPPRKFFLSPYSKSCRIIFMGSKDFLLMKSLAALPTHNHIHLFNSCFYSQMPLLPANFRKNSRIFASPKHFSPSYQRVPGCSYTPYSAMPNSRPSKLLSFSSYWSFNLSKGDKTSVRGEILSIRLRVE